MRWYHVLTLAPLLLLATFALSGSACSDDGPATQSADADATSAADAAGDTPSADTGEADVGEPDQGVLDTGPPAPGERVQLDLSPYLDQQAEQGLVRVFQIDSDEDRIRGERAVSRVGDYVLENDLARFAIERDVRAIGPCPYGGNVIDAELRVTPPQLDDLVGGDVIGEICLLINAGLTLKPDTFEILRDGSEGAGVLAVTGQLQLLDFIDIVGMARVNVGLELEPSFDIEAIPPVTVTVYYILHPGELMLRVVAAVRNDGTEQVDLAQSQLIDVGGMVEIFNPLSSTGGFGLRQLGTEAGSEPLPFVAMRGQYSSYAYHPDPADYLTAPLPIAGSYVYIGGVTVAVLGISDVLGMLLLPPNRIPTQRGLLHLQPQQVEAIAYRFYTGDGSLATMLDELFALSQPETGLIEGVVRDTVDDLVPGARVTAVNADGLPMSQAVSDDGGGYEMRLPAGDYEVRAFLPGQYTVATVPVTVIDDESATANLTVTTAGTLTVRVRDPEGEAVPARVTVFCDGGCPPRPSAQEAEDLIRPPSGTAALEFSDTGGELSFRLPPGPYRVVASRGMEWSVWPPDAHEAGGRPVDVVAGETLEVAAEIAHVVDTAAAMTGDFHVHSIPSPDSRVRLTDRVRAAMSEGLDVAVTTDHDVITDMRPALEALSAGNELVTLVGEELTTATYGHYNAFPLGRDPQVQNGGAFDWAGGTGPGMTPAEIFAWFHDQPGEQVVIANHPGGNGLVGSLLADPLRGQSFMEREILRLPPAEPDPVTGDTGLWTDDFTATEVMNGYGVGRMWSVMRFWFAMMGRGFTPTGLAVSDTHGLHRDFIGAPRTFVFVPEESDTPATFDVEAFVAAINAGRAIGSTGPFFRLVARNTGGDEAGLGDVIATDGEPVEIEIAMELPEWMRVDAVDLFWNPDGVDTRGAVDDDPITPNASYPIEWMESDLEVVAQGAETHRRWRKVMHFDVEVDQDAFVVVVVHGPYNDGTTMFPVVMDSAIALAFSNPIFIDADGGGYDRPYLLPLLEE